MHRIGLLALVAMMFSGNPAFGALDQLKSHLAPRWKMDRVRDVCKKVAPKMKGHALDQGVLDFKESCLKAVNHLFELFEFDHVATPVFGGRCEELARDNETMTLVQTLQSTEGGSLWNTVNGILGQKEKAIEFMAIFLQGSPMSLVPTSEFDCGGATIESQADFEAFYASLEAMLGDHNTGLYPEEVGAEHSERLRLLYHFYVPAYTTLRLIRKGNSPEISAFISFVYNANFELVTRAIKNMNVSKKGFLDFADDAVKAASLRFVDVYPNKVKLSLEDKSEKADINDIYLGLQGVRFALGESSPTYQAFHQSISSDYRSFLVNEVLMGGQP